MAMWAPKRPCELEMIPDAQPFAEPWLKHLVTHEYRHAVQFRQSVPPFYEGARVRARTTGRFRQFGARSGLVSRGRRRDGRELSMSSFGRALQPSFTVECRAYLTEGKQRFPLDKWFCGSYRNYIPDHYQFGYQLVAWLRESGTATTCGRASPYRGAASVYDPDDQMGAAQVLPDLGEPDRPLDAGRPGPLLALAARSSRTAPRFCRRP